MTLKYIIADSVCNIENQNSENTFQCNSTSPQTLVKSPFEDEAKYFHKIRVKSEPPDIPLTNATLENIWNLIERYRQNKILSDPALGQHPRHASVTSTDKTDLVSSLYKMLDQNEEQRI